MGKDGGEDLKRREVGRQRSESWKGEKGGRTGEERREELIRKEGRREEEAEVKKI